MADIKQKNKTDMQMSKPPLNLRCTTTVKDHCLFIPTQTYPNDVEN